MQVADQETAARRGSELNSRPLDAPNSRLAAGTALHVVVGQHTHPGGRPRNEDFAAYYVGAPSRHLAIDVIAVLANGMGGARGGRVAAESAVRGFIDGCLGQSITRGECDPRSERRLEGGRPRRGKTPPVRRARSAGGARHGQLHGPRVVRRRGHSLARAFALYERNLMRFRQIVAALLLIALLLALALRS